MGCQLVGGLPKVHARLVRARLVRDGLARAGLGLQRWREGKPITRHLIHRHKNATPADQSSLYDQQHLKLLPSRLTIAAVSGLGRCSCLKDTIIGAILELQPS